MLTLWLLTTALASPLTVADTSQLPPPDRHGYRQACDCVWLTWSDPQRTVEIPKAHVVSVHHVLGSNGIEEVILNTAQTPVVLARSEVDSLRIFAALLTEHAGLLVTDVDEFGRQGLGGCINHEIATPAATGPQALFVRISASGEPKDIEHIDALVQRSMPSLAACVPPEQPSMTTRIQLRFNAQNAHSVELIDVAEPTPTQQCLHEHLRLLPLNHRPGTEKGSLEYQVWWVKY